MSDTLFYILLNFGLLALALVIAVAVWFEHHDALPGLELGHDEREDD